VSGVKKSRAAYFFQKHVRVFCRLSRDKPRIGDYVFRAKMTWESGSAKYSVLYGFTQSCRITNCGHSCMDHPTKFQQVH
jgi:hypothetical protein